MSDFALPPDLAIEQQLIAQRERLAQMMAQRSMQPISSGSPMSVVSPLQVAGQMFAGHRANQMQQGVEGDTRKLGENYNQMLSQGVKEYMAKRNGTAPAIPQPDAELGGGPGAPAGRDADPQGAILDAMTSRNPLLRNIGSMDYQHQLKRTDPYTLNEGDLRVNPGGPSVSNPKEAVHALPADWKKDLPAGYVLDPKDPAGVFRLKGTDGQMDVYELTYERGKKIGQKKLDSSQIIRDPGTNSMATTTIQDPKDPTKTLVVRTAAFDPKKYLAGDSTGVVGPGPKASTEGVQRAEGFATFQNVNANLDKLEKQVQLTLDSKLGRTTGLAGKIPNVPGFAGADAEGRLEGLKSQVGFEALQALRNAAHNGASGLGQVTEKEHIYLQTQLGNLAKAQSEKEIRRVLGEIQTWVAGARERYKQAYEKRFNAGGQQPGGNQPPEGFTPL